MLSEINVFAALICLGEKIKKFGRIVVRYRAHTNLTFGAKKVKGTCNNSSGYICGNDVFSQRIAARKSTQQQENQHSSKEINTAARKST